MEGRPEKGERRVDVKESGCWGEWRGRVEGGRVKGGRAEGVVSVGVECKGV